MKTIKNREGLVVKVISNQFYVNIDGKEIITTEKGLLRHNKTLPLVGDKVLVDLEKKVIVEILPRKNEILRPNVSNITQAFIVTSLKHPDFSTNLLDKLIVQLEINKIKPVICLTKIDLIDNFNDYNDIFKYYQELGYLVLTNLEIDKIKKTLEGEITVFIGQTGAGKSTLLNKLFPSLNLKTGEISLALGRGRHTTRYTQIIQFDNIKVLDSPGFSALSFLKYQKEDVKNSFLEFSKYPCIYSDCSHIKESECNVKKAVNNGKILKSRYENYLTFINEFENRR